MVRLLRWTDLTAHGSSCAFYGLGRALTNNTARDFRRCVRRIIDIDIMHWIYFRKKPIVNS